MIEFEITNFYIALVAVVAGLALLLVGGEVLVKGSVALASRLGIPRLIIGMTIVAFGTSVPELFIGLQSVLQGSTDLALGNVVGSNIANVLLVLGLPSILYPTLVKEHGVRRNMMMMIAASVILIWMGQDGLLSFSDGVTLVLLLTIFFAVQVHHARNSPESAARQDELAEIEQVADGDTSGLATFFFILIGLLLLPIGANLLVTGSVKIATDLGVQEAVIGLSLVAVGTSLPELAISIVATLRRHASVAIGNVLGSNVLNIGAVMGLTTVFAGKKGIPVTEQFLAFDFWVMLATALLIVPFAFMKKGAISRPIGLLFMIFYCVYIYWIFQTGRVA